MAGLLDDDELRDILGDSYGSFKSELESAFRVGWDREILASSINAPGFMGSSLMGSGELAGSAVKSVISRATEPFSRFSSLPKHYRQACFELALGLCSSGGPVDSILSPPAPYSMSIPRPQPSPYASSAEWIIHSR